MLLREALTIASKFVSENSPMVSLGEGRVSATTGQFGVVLHCPAADYGVVTDCKELLKVVKGLPEDAVIRKGRKLEIKSEKARASYALSTVRDEPWLPEAPAAGWREVSELQLGAIRRIIGGVEQHERFPGVRIAPTFAAVMSGHAALVAWIGGLTEFPRTVARELFLHVEGTCALAFDDRRAYLKDSKGNLYWASMYTMEFPDSELNELLTRSRLTEHRRQVAINANELRELCAHAEVVELSKADTLRLSLTETALVIASGPESRGLSQFEGDCPVASPGPRVGPVGIRPGMLKKVVDAVDTEHLYFSVASALDPITIVGGDPVVEALVMPSYLSPATPEA